MSFYYEAVLDTLTDAAKERRAGDRTVHGGDPSIKQCALIAIVFPHAGSPAFYEAVLDILTPPAKRLASSATY